MHCKKMLMAAAGSAGGSAPPAGSSVTPALTYAGTTSGDARHISCLYFDEPGAWVLAHVVSGTTYLASGLWNGVSTPTVRTQVSLSTANGQIVELTKTGVNTFAVAYGSASAREYVRAFQISADGSLIGGGELMSTSSDRVNDGNGICFANGKVVVTANAGTATYTNTCTISAGTTLSSVGTAQEAKYAQESRLFVLSDGVVIRELYNSVCTFRPYAIAAGGALTAGTDVQTTFGSYFGAGAGLSMTKMVWAHGVHGARPNLRMFVACWGNGINQTATGTHEFSVGNAAAPTFSTSYADVHTIRLNDNGVVVLVPANQGGVDGIYAFEFSVSDTPTINYVTSSLISTMPFIHFGFCPLDGTKYGYAALRRGLIAGIDTNNSGVIKLQFVNY